MTKKGNHKKNQDTILVNDKILKEGFYYTESVSLKAFVSDGVGGLNSGEVASEFVCRELKDTKNITEEAIKDINSRLVAFSDTAPEYSCMATTLSGIVISEDISNIIHVGDSRISILEDGCLSPVTSDHTPSTWVVSTTNPHRKKASTYRKLNTLLACMGGGDEKYADMLVFKNSQKTFEDAERIIITTDGIHDFLEETELEDLLTLKDCDLENIFSEIINIATKNGSSDDKSIILIEK